ncbi:MAG: hypothetical protein ACE5DS_09110 [Kiloniellaceae bacterium]
MSSVTDNRATTTSLACSGKPAVARARALALDPTPTLYNGDEALLLICP